MTIKHPARVETSSEMVERLQAELAAEQAARQKYWQALCDARGEITAITRDIETGFMQGAYARLKNLQDEEREVYTLRAELAAMTAYADRLAAGLPVGMLPQDIENVKRANERFAEENTRLRKELEWFTEPGNYPGTARGDIYALAAKSTAVLKARAALEVKP
jgi:hypothetical protein